MPKVVKKNQTPTAYDLRKTFASEDRGKRFTSGEHLRAWFDIDFTPASVVNSLTLSKVNSPGTGTTTEFDFNFNHGELASGDNSYYYSADNSLYSFSNNKPLTFSVWVKPEAFDGDSPSALLSKGNFESSPGNKEYDLSLVYNDDGHTVQLLLYDATNNTSLIGAATNVEGNDFVFVGRWYHLAVTYDGTSDPAGIKIYINGKKQKTTHLQTVSPAFNSLGNGDRALGIGVRDQGSTPVRFFEGLIGELSIFGSALTSEEVLAIYDATTSGVRKVKSGIISNPPRYRIRQLDQKSHTYPSKLTMGDHDVYGNARNTPFDANLSLQYGRKFESKFELKEEFKPGFLGGGLQLGVLTPHVPGTLRKLPEHDWVTSRYMQIRQETITGDKGESFNDGALVFAGADNDSLHTTGSRWIRTSEKIRNPEVQFDLLVGPYDNRRSPDSSGLRLKRGTLQDSLKIQCLTGSLEGNSWKTIKTINAVTSSFLFNALTPTMIAEGSDPSIILPRRIKTRPSQKSRIGVHLRPNDFKALGDSDFYLRIIQETPSDPRKYNWAIGSMTIKSANQDIVLPLGVPKDSKAYQNLFNNYIASPNFNDQLSVKARSISGLSEKHLDINLVAKDPTHFSPGVLSAYNEDRAIASFSSENSFFEVGTPPSVLPGFGSKLADKTQIVIDLSPSEEKRFGCITKAGQVYNTDTELSGTHTATLGGGTTQIPNFMNFGNPQNLMVYWNNVDKKWESLNGNFNSNMYSGSTGPTGSLGLHRRIQGNYAGFAPISACLLTGTMRANESNASAMAEAIKTAEFVSPTINQSQGLATDLFGFPYSGKYHATSSATIRARDYGITKPFLLEKCSLTFDSNFQIPPVHQVKGDGNYSELSTFRRYSQMPTLLPAGSTLEYHKEAALAFVQPTFFMLRQFNKRFIAKKSVPYKTDLKVSFGYNHYDLPLIMSDKRHPHSEKPKQIGISSIHAPQYSGSAEAIGDRTSYNTVHDIPKSTSRELITYGRVMIGVSGSNVITVNNPNSIDSEVHATGMTLEEAVETGLNRDLEILVDSTTGYDSNSPFAVTGSALQLNFDARNTAKIKGFVNNVVLFHTGTRDLATDYDYPYRVVIGCDNSGGRESGQPGESSRSTSNPVGGFRRSKDETFPALATGSYVFDWNNAADTLLDLSHIPVYENLNQHSPYVIMPDDELIFGWQYGLPHDMSRGPVFANTPDNHMWSMTLLGRAKLHLYGSMIKDGAEYHDSRNQNLTSNAVHEVVGSEPIIDQWQISQRSEHAGGVLDNLVDVRVITASAGETPAIARIGAPVKSIIHDGHIDNGTHATTASAGTSFLYNKTAFNRFTTATNTNKAYLDSVRTTGHFFGVGLTKGREGLPYLLHTTHSYVPGFHTTENPDEISSPASSSEVYASSSYGTMQTDGASISPKYAFNARHFGHFADNIQQARDGRFVVPPIFDRSSQDGVFSSPVAIRFVSGSSTKNFRIRSYYLNDTPSFIGNKSAHSTSSFGFIDNFASVGDDSLTLLYLGPLVLQSQLDELAKATSRIVIS